MAKKSETKPKMESLAQLEQESGSTEPVHPNPHVQAERDKKPEMRTVTLPRHPSTGKPITVRVNHKEYHGTVTVEATLASVLVEMGEKIVERERNITVGKKFDGGGRGVRGMRQVGNV